MKLFELFNAPVNWAWTQNRNTSCKARFEVGGVKYIFYAHLVNNDTEEWTVEFASGNGTKFSHGVTGTGNAAIVFATIVNIMKEFLQMYSPQKIIFSADEPNRKKLYKRMVTSLLPSWHVEENSEFIMLSKN